MILKTQAPEFDNSFLIVRAFVKFLNLRTNHATWTDGSRPWSGSKRSKKKWTISKTWNILVCVLFCNWALLSESWTDFKHAKAATWESNRTNKSLLPTVKQCRVEWSEPHFVLFLSGGASRRVAKAEHKVHPWPSRKSFTLTQGQDRTMDHPRSHQPRPGTKCFCKVTTPKHKNTIKNTENQTKTKPTQPTQPTGQKIRTAWAGCKKHEARTR